MPVQYPIFNGLPGIPPNVAEALSGLGDVSVPDVNFGANVPDGQIQKIWDSITKSLCPPVVPDSEIDSLKKAIEDNPDQAASLQTTLAAAQTANMFASPAVRVFILFWVVSILLSIVRKIPGVRGVPSLSGMMSALATGGFDFQMDHDVKSGWAVLPLGSISLTGTWDGHEITNQEFVYAGEPRHSQWPIPVFPDRNSEHQGNYYLKTCYGEIIVGPDEKPYVWEYDSEPCRPAASNFQADYQNSSGTHVGATGRQFQITITDGSRHFECTRIETSTKGRIKEFVSRDLNSVSSADGSLALPRDVLTPYAMTFGEGEVSYGYEMTRLSSGGKKVSWSVSYHCMTQIGRTTEHPEDYPRYLKLSSSDFSDDLYFTPCKIHFFGLKRKDGKRGGILGPLDGETWVSYYAEKVVVFGMSYASNTGICQIARVEITDSNKKGSLRLKTDDDLLEDPSTNSTMIVWENGLYSFSADSESEDAFVEIGNFQPDVVNDWWNSTRTDMLEASRDDSLPSIGSQTNRYPLRSLVFKNETSSEYEFHYYLNDLSPRAFSPVATDWTYPGFGQVDGFDWVAPSTGHDWTDDDDYIYTIRAHSKVPVATWGAGKLVTKESVSSDFSIPETPSVVLQDSPAIGFEVLRPCTYPPAGMDSKMQMLIASGAGKYEVMAAFGCCYTEELWEKYQELKKIAMAKRSFIKW